MSGDGKRAITERQAAIRLLKWMMAASLVLPAALFIVVGWFNYRDFERYTDQRIQRTLGILDYHTHRALETIELTFDAASAMTRGMSDDDILRDEAALHDRLKLIVTSLPRMHEIVIIGRDGHALVSSNRSPAPRTVDYTDTPCFKELKTGNVSGTYLSPINMPLGERRGYSICLSQRRHPADGAFNGVILVSVLTTYFEDFYSYLSSLGLYFAAVRTDGNFLARYPVPVTRSVQLDNDSQFRVRVAEGLDSSVYTVDSQLDRVARRIGYRKIAGYPLYVLAGVDRRATIAEWLRYNMNYLLFGLPLAALLFAGLGLALRRTQRLYDEHERREAAETGLRKARRLEAIGQLTGGVAHDFNNLLMVISGSVDRLRKSDTEKTHTRLLDMIGTATQRGETLTRQLLTFSRRQILSPQVIDLSQHLPMARDMLTRSLRSDITIEVDAPAAGCRVKVDPGELELAILNLAINAKDAMADGGTLSIGVEPVTLKGEAVVDGLAGEFVALSVSDTGSGMPAHVLARAFEPFFTTKEVGKGTGLGLSQVYGFAKQSGGTATASSTEKRGATITIYLPCCWEAPSIVAAPIEEQASPDRAGTVLLVEDNSDVAEVSAEYLRQLGYRVRNVANAQAALASLRTDAAIDLVFSDILMPGGMNGLELAREINARFPAIPVLLTTGYSASASDAVTRGIVVLRKPFNLELLRRHIHEAIAAVRKHGQHAPDVY